MKPKSYSRFFGLQSSSSLALITVCALGSASLAHAQTWTNTSSSDWNIGGNWDTTVAPVSGNTTAVKFFATPGTVVPAASVIVANQNIATPMILNSLTVNGTGPGSGAAPSLTLSGGAIQFAGVSPVLNVNAAYGGVGYTVNLNTNLDFNADTAINFSNGGAFINVGTAAALSGAGKVTFTGGLTNRALSLTPTGTFTGDMVLNGSSSVLQLNKNNNILGPNTATTQAVTVASGSGVNLAYGNAAYTHPQNFVVNGNGNAGTADAAVNATQINFGNPVIGGLALATDSTVRLTLNDANQNRGLVVTRGIVGTGKLVKTGNAYLFPNVVSPASVTWGGAIFSEYTGNVEIKEGAIQTPNVSNALGSNAATTQRVTVSPGAAMIIGAGTNAWTQPQNMILNGSGTGYIVNNGGSAALDSFGTAFGSNTVRRIVVATDSSVAVKRDGNGSGLGTGLNAQQGISGTGNLTVGAPYGSATGPLYVNQASTAFEEFPIFSGKVIINNGILNIGNATALGATSAGQITLSDLGAVSSTLGGGLDQAFLSRIANLSTTGGAVCLGNASANNLDFTSAPNLRLGSINNSTYSGTLTPAGGVYRLGGGGGNLTVSSLLAAPNSVVISGSVILTNPGNTFAGGITVASNNTGLGQTASLGFTGGTGNLNGNAISFGGAGGALAYTGSATGSSDSLGALAFATGHSNITSTKGAAGNTSLTFSSMTARSAGATGNFSISGGTNGTDNKISVTGLAAGFVDKGVFFGDFNYAYNDATGFLRAPVYGTDAGFVTSVAAASVASATHQQITGALSAQNSATFTTLKINGANNVAMAADQVLTVNGILKSGNNATTVSGTGAAALQASSGSEMVIRTDAGSDAVTLGIPIQDNGFSSLTKTGAGTLTLNAGNSYTGATTVVAGTLTVGGTGSLEDTSPVIVNGGTFNSNNSSDTVGNVTLKNGLIGGSAIILGNSYAVENGMVTGRLGGSGALTKTTSGQVILTALNYYSGGTTISGGALTVTATGSLDDSGSVTINNGASYELGGSDTVGNVILIDGTIRGPGALSGDSYDVRSGRIEAPLAGFGTLTKSTAGTVTLAAVNTISSTTSITQGTLALDASGSIAESSDVSIAAGAKLETVLQTNYAIPTGKTVTFGLNAAGAGTSGQINAAGLDITNATVAFDITGTLDDAAYVLATYTSKTGAAFLSVPAVTGYTINYAFNGGTQIALVQSVVSDYNSWLALYPSITSASDKLPTADPDGDGLTNQNEYAFGLAPNSGSSVNPILLQVSKSAGTFTYQRRSSSGLAYTVWTSPDLVTWTLDSGATQTPGTPGVNNVQSVAVQLSGSLPLAATKLFVRVKAQ